MDRHVPDVEGRATRSKRHRQDKRKEGVSILGYREIRAKRIFPFQRLSVYSLAHPYIRGAIVWALFRSYELAPIFLRF